MIDATGLLRLLQEGESSWVEFKESPTDGEKIRQDVCALANDLPGRQAPGYIFVGVDDRGRPTGLRIDDRLLQQLAATRDDGTILPLPHITVDRVVLHGTPVAVMTVWPSAALPVRYKGDVWIRTGPTRDKATLQQERILVERDIAGTLPFDLRPCLAATIEDLDIEPFLADYLPRVVAPAVLKENNRSLKYRLASLRFFDLHRDVPTNLGVLTFGRDPTRFLPGAYLQVVVYDGETRAGRVLNHKAINGRLREQMLQLDALLPVQIHTARLPGSGLRKTDQPDYPLAALTEFVINAVMHRTYEGTGMPVQVYWYSDRIEIQNPGGLYGQVTPENFERVNDYRIPGIAEVLKALRYVERFGSGIARAQAALLGNGNPPARFQFAQTHVRVTLLSAPRTVDAAAKGLPSPADSPAVPDPSSRSADLKGDDEPEGESEP